MSQAGHESESPTDDDAEWPEPTPLFAVSSPADDAAHAAGNDGETRRFDWPELWREMDGLGALRPAAPEPSMSASPPVVDDADAEEPVVPATVVVEAVAETPAQGVDAGDETRRRRAPHRVVLAGLHLLVLVVFVAALVAALVGAGLLLLTYALRAAVT